MLLLLLKLSCCFFIIEGSLSSLLVLQYLHGGEYNRIGLDRNTNTYCILAFNRKREREREKEEGGESELSVGRRERREEKRNREGDQKYTHTQI